MMRGWLLLLGYGCGLLQTGYLYGKMKGIDIRTRGSGNSGATNTLRVLGKKAGLIVFFGDFLKCLIPCLIVRALYAKSQPEAAVVYMEYMALGVILGHNYPFYLGFKGGKGIACTSALIVALDLRIAAVCLVCFTAVVAATRYVSVGSLLVASLNLILGIWFYRIGWIPVGETWAVEYSVLLFVSAALAFWRHRSNLARLLHGTENKLGAKKTE